MDPQLPAQLVQLLAPFLPSLLEGVKLAGQEAARKPGEKAGEQGFERAKALWEKLRPKVKARPAALEAVQDAAARFLLAAIDCSTQACASPNCAP